MVNQCANPECKRELHYLREGRIYLFALSTPTELHEKQRVLLKATTEGRY
jgi:hypothetical protein